MAALKPEDHEHTPSFTAAVGAVATSSPRHTEFITVYRSAAAWLETAGMPGIPLGSFTRLLSAAGHPLLNTQLPNGKRIKYVKHLALKETQ